MNNVNEEFETSKDQIEEFDNSVEKITIPVIEEQVKVSKKVIETARVKLSKTVTENIESVEIPLVQEEIVVKRIPKNEFIDVIPPASRYEGDIMIIPVLKEVAVVEKRMMLVEEIHVSKVKTEKTETHEVAVRKEEIKVSRTKL